ncbi:MAG: hypothetical protein WAV23_02815 [Minisyncoccia bacterium]
MAKEALTQEVAIDKLPFNIERKNNHIEVYSKPAQHLSRQKRKKFENQKIIVELFLFRKDDIDHLHKLQSYNFEDENTFYNILSNVKEKFISLLLKK